MKKLYFVMAILVIASMALAACGAPATEAPVATEMPAMTEAPAATEAPATEAAADVVKVGQVTDLGGIDDKSFNAGAYEGIENAVADFGVEGKYLESTQQSDYNKNIQQFVDEGTDLIITVGFLLGVDTAVAAKANPDTNFAIVDYSYPDCFGTDFVEGQTCGSAAELPNVLGLTFQTDQAGFLAGYAAAATTETGTVATFGGINIPPVVIFMKGFEAGVKYYNEEKGTAVEVLGWNTAAADGSFTGNFDSTDDGRSFAESFVQEGADIIMPVAGPVGLGSAAYCQESGSCKIIGVDVDWTVSAAEYTDVILTSVLKNVNVAVYDATAAVVDGTFAGGVYTGTIANGGVGLADVAGASDELIAELEAVSAALSDGSLTVDGVLGQ
jgi:basic membrane protein A and related proteins